MVLVGTKCCRTNRAVTKAEGQVRPWPPTLAPLVEPQTLLTFIKPQTICRPHHHHRRHHHHHQQKQPTNPTVPQKLADRYKMPFCEVSVRNRINVNAPFLALTRKLLAAQHYQYRPVTVAGPDTDTECVNCQAPSRELCKCKERV